jgi:hypothetical protein
MQNSMHLPKFPEHVGKTCLKRKLFSNTGYPQTGLPERQLKNSKISLTD